MAIPRSPPLVTVSHIGLEAARINRNEALTLLERKLDSIEKINQVKVGVADARSNTFKM